MRDDFNFAKRKTRNFGRCLFYLGYVILILNVIGVVFEFLGYFIDFEAMTTEKKRDLQEFGKGHIFFIKLFKMGKLAITAAQGFLMIKMTRHVLKQIGSQEANPQT